VIIKNKFGNKFSVNLIQNYSKYSFNKKADNAGLPQQSTFLTNLLSSYPFCTRNQSKAIFSVNLL